MHDILAMRSTKNRHYQKSNTLSLPLPECRALWMEPRPLANIQLCRTALAQSHTVEPRATSSVLTAS